MWRYKPLHCLLYLTYQAAGAREESAIAQLRRAMEKPAGRTVTEVLSLTETWESRNYQI